MQCCARRVLPLDQMGVWVGMARHDGKERSGRVDVCLGVCFDGCDGNCDGFTL
jgi:modification target Cys-rich repeat protein